MAVGLNGLGGQPVLEAVVLGLIREQDHVHIQLRYMVVVAVKGAQRMQGDVH